jgi:hypothetical protein
MGRWNEISKWRNTNTTKKLLNIFSNQGNANQSYIEIPSHQSEWISSKNQKHNTSGNNKEEKESLYTVSEYVN